MPLLPGKANIGRNITELERPSAHAPRGREYEQALAIALKTAGVPKRRADGGGVSDGFTGPLTGDTPGRADALPVTVPDGSHVINAEAVSAIGGGNTAAGLKHLSKIFPTPKAGPAPKTHIAAAPMPQSVHLLAPKIKVPIPKMPHLHGMPRATGGKAGGVACRLSDGEFVISPEHVKRIGEGDPERGHRALDAWQMKIRQDHIAKLKSLPKPVGA